MTKAARIGVGVAGALSLLSAFILYVAWPLDVALPWLLVFLTAGVSLTAAAVVALDESRTSGSAARHGEGELA